MARRIAITTSGERLFRVVMMMIVMIMVMVVPVNLLVSIWMTIILVRRAVGGQVFGVFAWHEFIIRCSFPYLDRHGVFRDRSGGHGTSERPMETVAP